MSRLVSFIVLVAILLGITTLFVVVMAGFILPLFIALLLVVMFEPVHRWFIAKCKGRLRVAAGLTTLTIVLMLLLPLLAIFYQAVSECQDIYGRIKKRSNHPPAQIAVAESPAPADASEPGEPDEKKSIVDTFVDPSVLADAVVKASQKFGLALSETEIQATIRQKLDEWIGPVALGTARFSVSLLIVLGVTTISTYYFFADGPWMVRSLMRLSPLDDRYEEALFEEFVRITRAVVVATLLSAVVQGLLAGLGFFIAGINAVFLLMVLTMFLAMIPFVGAGAVWIPVCIWLFFFADPPRHVAAVLLAVYGAGIVSMADNVIKPLVLHGRSNIHPLLALLSVIGGVRTLGPIGIFVGPMAVAFLHALLNMFHGEVERMSEDGAEEAASPDEEESDDSEEACPSAEEETQPGAAAEEDKATAPAKKNASNRR
jgi:predicted PurR-regulated permease PerM